MTNQANISARIEALATEAGEHGDLEMVKLCDRVNGRVLRDSRTNNIVAPEKLFGNVPMVCYILAICESLDSGTAEGHISVRGRTVYAA